MRDTEAPIDNGAIGVFTDDMCHSGFRHRSLRSGGTQGRLKDWPEAQVLAR